jgi:putative transposase
VAHHTTLDPAARRAPDLVQRDFSATRPDALWLADFTYLCCWEGVVFFSFVIDAYSRRIVGWQFASHMRSGTRSGNSMALTPEQCA